MRSTAAASQNNKLAKTFARRKKSLSQFWSRFSRNRLATASLFVIAFFVLVAVFAGQFYDYEFITSNQLQNSFLKPGEIGSILVGDQMVEYRYLLGADNYGRDILGRIIHGSRVSLLIGFETVAMALGVGGILGALAGYKGKLIDAVIMRATDVLLSIPTILLAIAIVAALGRSFFNLLIAIGVALTPNYIRIVRAEVIAVKNQDFIEAARCIGASDFRIISKHVLVNIAAPLIVQSTLNVGGSILWASSLSFLGLGILPPQPEWGNMLSEAREFIQYAPHTLFFPGLAIMIVVLAYNLIGDGLRDAIDPKLKQ